MKIAVMGTGGVGGPFGAALAADGHDVTFIARGAHLAAMRERGLRIEGTQQIRLRPTRATDDPSTIGPVDVVLFTVKLWDVESGGEVIKPLLGPNTAVVALQNGVDAEERLAAVIGPEHVMGGVAEIFATITEPGVIRQFSAFHRMRFGELNGARSARGEALLAACEAAGIEAEFTDDIDKVLWNKFISLAAVSGLTSVTRATVGALRADPDTRALVREAIYEVAAVGRARGVNIDSDFEEEALRRVDHMPADGRSSMAVDLDRGNRLELPWLNGIVVRLGRELGIATPVNRFIYAALKLHENGR